jgi:hypothetical protein
MLFNGLKAGVLGVVLVGGMQAGVTARSASSDSERLGRAKDYIAEEQWVRAIAELREAARDRGEKEKDEALYWLAHSLNQAGDSAAAIATIRRLEREHPKSLWVKPAGSLRLDIAVHMQRSDVLWWMAAPPAPPPPPHAPAAPVVAGTEVPPAVTPVAPAAPVKGARLSPPPPPPGRILPPGPPPPPMPPPPAAWLPEVHRPDNGLRIQALGRLMQTDAPRVIPILKEIALAGGDPREASRAVFVLAQSGRTEARDSVMEVARQASDPVRIAAVRELGRFAGPEISRELMGVYATATAPVKLQVVTSLGERAERKALLEIAEGERDPHVRASAIVTLGQAGGGEQLGLLYQRAGREAKRPIIIGLFNARAEDELIRIADREKDPQLRDEALLRLRLLGTPKARAYIQKAGGIR